VKRLLAIASVLVAAAALAVVGTGAGSGGKPYLVRAIFDNAGFMIAGEDVKVAGVKVGSIDSVSVTPENRAAIVLRIDDPGYRDFRADATCQVRPQSLIGEKYVECVPTRARAVGSPGAPALRRIEDGEGAGQRLLPVENTMKSVDLDMLNDIMRLPYRQRFSIILNEFGTGLAGRGKDLRDVIRRADPALREVDRVLAILASQNKTLTRLATDSDRVIAPLSRDRRSVTRFIARSGDVAAATAERRDALEATVTRLPRFLAELTPTMQRLGAFADQASPVFADLGARAPQINQVVRQLGPFSQAGTPALKTLGHAAKVGMPALEDARPITRELRTFARTAKPVSSTLANVLQSFDRTGGTQRLMDFLFYGVAAINGYDDFGHYLRAALLVNTCSSYKTSPVPGCLAKFRPPETATTATAPAQPAAPAPAPAPAASLAPAPASAPTAGTVAEPTSPADAAVLDYLFQKDAG
jgi:phospholipid/cholesterol/gamma-HCH transport system substrate-binding protein